jgi:hypothetical protein
MRRRHGRLALPVALVLGAAALSLGALAALDGRVVGGSAGGSAVRRASPAVDAAVLPAKVDPRAEHLASARPARQRLPLLTGSLAAAGMGIAWAAGRRARQVPERVTRELAPARTAPQRAPPGLRLAAS